jgi:hypothetical protein
VVQYSAVTCLTSLIRLDGPPRESGRDSQALDVDYDQVKVVRVTSSSMNAMKSSFLCRRTTHHATNEIKLFYFM